jgi:prepilin-type N-terminal cleavage/methylation domain-containing protein
MKNHLRDNKGYSLVELLVVIAIIAIMVAVATPMLSKQLPKWHMNGTARDIAAKLMMARLRAIHDNSKYGVEFASGSPDTFEVVEDVSGTWIGVGVRSESYSDVSVTPTACTSNRIEFNADGTATAGSCSSASSLVVVTVVTTVGSLSRTITLNTYTGNITVD